MTFKNIFGNGKNEARAAEESSRNVHEKIPGARPEWEGVDPELLEGIPEVERDPKLVRETSPEALAIMNGFVTPLFQNTQTAASTQQDAAEDPASASDMASAAKDKAFEDVEVEIDEKDRPDIDAEERERLKNDNHESTKNVQGFDRKPPKG
ncbi:hypothetical protein [Nocardiopsis alba]|uniref:hypothetical protein n=1 Tax=Nocardiopsis alba TaxID=53437 RepID=UPI0035D5C5C2